MTKNKTPYVKIIFKNHFSEIFLKTITKQPLVVFNFNFLLFIPSCCYLYIYRYINVCLHFFFKVQFNISISFPFRDSCKQRKANPIKVRCLSCDACEFKIKKTKNKNKNKKSPTDPALLLKS